MEFMEIMVSEINLLPPISLLNASSGSRKYSFESTHVEHFFHVIFFSFLLSFFTCNCWIAVTKGSSAIRDNNHRLQFKQQQQQQMHSQEKMSNDDESTTGKNQTSILKLSHRYVCVWIILIKIELRLKRSVSFSYIASPSVWHTGTSVWLAIF